MEGQGISQHPELGEFVDYFAGRLPLPREVELDLHFSACDECAEAARRVRLLFSLANRWSAAEHRHTVDQARVAEALERASAADSCRAWRGRLTHWAEHWGGKSEAALLVAFHRVGSAVERSISSLGVLTRPGAIWSQFAPEVAMATRGPMAAASAVVSTSEDAPRLRVSAVDKDGRIEVDLEGPPVGLRPLVVLVPQDQTLPPALSEFRSGSLPSHYVAVFENVSVGEYTLVVEPLGSVDQPPSAVNPTRRA